MYQVLLVGTGSYNNGSVAIVGGNSFSVVFKAKSSGSANVSLGNIMIGDGSSTSGASATININSNTPAQTSTSMPTTTTEDNSSSSQPSSSLATTTNNNSTPEPTFKSVNDTVYAKKSINVRSSWSTSSSKVGGLSKDQEVTRTGIGDNGWSRISYNGKTAYVSTSLITTTKPEIITEEDKTEKENKTEEEIKNEEVIKIKEEIPKENQNSEIIIEESGEGVLSENKELTEKEIYQNLVLNIGTIPEVGKNYNVYLYILVCFINIFCIIFIFKKYK